MIYERRATSSIAGLAPSRLWWLDLSSGETVPVFDDTQWLGFGAAISPDGRWLSHVAPHKQGVQVYNLVDGRSLVVPSQLGEPAVWSPRSDFLLVRDVVTQESTFTEHIFRVNVESGQAVDLSGPDTLRELVAGLVARWPQHRDRPCRFRERSGGSDLAASGDRRGG